VPIVNVPFTEALPVALKFRRVVVPAMLWPPAVVTHVGQEIVPEVVNVPPLIGPVVATEVTVPPPPPPQPEHDPTVSAEM
jgi:hypothetical protein